MGYLAFPDLLFMTEQHPSDADQCGAITGPQGLHGSGCSGNLCCDVATSLQS
jgi:hypothetical protein